ncbi:MAG: glutamate formimidoyltransferase, partial [Actinomycetota bacterium]
LAGAAKAMELIDMNEHTGNHPRMGAVDVIPFIPVRDITMSECVELARDVARAVGDLGLPVYCYDQAALVPERRSLADVRKGEFEGLRDEVAAGKRLPDFGPHEIGRAGAVAVGARKPLVAFNVYFAGNDEAAAKQIARRVRESSGGLKNVRAVGFAVEERSCVTVSMNLVDTDATPIYRALELVRAEASRYGLTLLDTEIVGMVPEAALSESATYYLQLRGFDADEQVLERMVIGGGDSLGDFLDAVASSEPVPGGGTAAAITAATGAALVAMSARLTAGKKGFEGVTPRMNEIVVRADAARATLAGLGDRDAESFAAVMAAYKLPKATDDEKAARTAAVQSALVGASEVPLETARAAVDMLELAREVVETGNTNVASDAAAAAELLAAAIRGACRNIEINVASIKDAGFAEKLRGECDGLCARAAELAAAATVAFRSKISG